MSKNKMSVIITGIFLIILGLIIPNQTEKIQQELDGIVEINSEIIECEKNIDCIKTKERTLKAYESNRDLFQTIQNIKDIFFWVGVIIEGLILVPKLINKLSKKS